MIYIYIKKYVLYGVKRYKCIRASAILGLDGSFTGEAVLSGRHLRTCMCRKFLPSRAVPIQRGSKQTGSHTLFPSVKRREKTKAHQSTPSKC